MVTIKQIAEQAGISPSTVSIVLGGKAAQRKISAETQKRIFDIANQMGYQPNMAARSLRGGAGADELRIAMFWAQDFRAAMMVRFWDGLRRELESLDRKVKLIIHPYTNGQLCNSKTLTTATEYHAAIICNAAYEDLDFLKNTALAIPVVLYNRVCEGYSSVNVDDATMGALAAQAISAHGCKTAALLTGPAVFEGMDVRCNGFHQEAAKNDLTVESLPYCENSIRGGYQAVRDLLAGSWRDNMPDSLFCGSAMIAHGALRAFWDAGFQPSQQPKIIAIGNGSEEQDVLSIPSLSVIDMPMEKMAGECLRLLLQKLDGTSAAPESRLLQTRYIQRESC